jgi:hypothetical protein
MMKKYPYYPCCKCNDWSFKDGKDVCRKGCTPEEARTTCRAKTNPNAVSIPKEKREVLTPKIVQVDGKLNNKE